MTITLGQLIDARDVLGRIANRSLKGKTAFRIAQLLTELKPAQENFEKARTAILEANCIRNEQGEPMLEGEGAAAAYKIDPVKMDEASAELTNLLNTEVTVTNELDATIVDELDSLTAKDAMALMLFIEEPK